MAERKKGNLEEYQIDEVELIAGKLRSLRKSSGFTNHEEFAYACDIARAQYGRYEKGANLMLTTLMKILKYHGISLGEFFSLSVDEIITLKKARGKNQGSDSIQIYQFNILGEITARFRSVKEASINLEKNEEYIRSLIKRESYSRDGYYLSEDENFIPPITKSNHNPLFQKENNNRYK